MFHKYSKACLLITHQYIHIIHKHKSPLHKPPVRTTNALKSFRNVGINTWNTLSEDVRSSSTVSRVKTLCKMGLLNNMQS